MKKVEVNLKHSVDNSYPIIIGEGIIENAYDYIKNYTNARRFLIVTNEKVFPLYAEKLKAENSEFIILPDGEIYKNMEILNKILDKAIEIKLERKDAIIALGGGVIGDIAGFSASIYQRGIDFIQIPTTLLAQVDSSVGGKTAVNHKAGKNLIGAFYQPKLVLADVNTLDTLDNRQFKTGLSEVIKYAFIEKSCKASCDYNLFDFLKSNKTLILNKDKEIMKELIRICCELKASVVNFDEKEKGLRAILNFGHTYAHAIENITKYEKYTHGEAVSIGMKCIFNLAYSLSRISENYYKKAIELLNDYELITSLDFEPDMNMVYNSMKSDKKIADGNINFIMPVDEYKVIMENNIDKNLVLAGIK